MINLFISIALLLIGIALTIDLLLLGYSKNRIEFLIYAWLAGSACVISALIFDVMWIVSLFK